MKKLIRTIAVGLMSAASLTGCASITASRTESFAVVSRPSGAQVKLNGVPAGVTPTRVEIPRKANGAIVEVELAGHRPETCALHHSAGGGYVAADVVMCVVLFPLGCIAFIDADGSWNELQTPMCSVDLQPLPAANVTPVPPSTAVPSS